MPVYEFECEKCHSILEEYFPMMSNARKIACNCGGVAVKIMSKTTAKVFVPQRLDIIDDNEEPVFVNSTHELKDAIKRYNDSKWSTSGKVAVLE